MSAIKPTYEELVQRVRELEEEAIKGRQLEKKLREIEARFKTLFENAPEAIVIIDAEIGKFVDANTKALRLFGLTREEFIGIGPLDISPPIQPDGRLSKEVVQEKIQELLSENPKPFEWVHKNSSGREFPCEIYHAKLPVPGRKLFSAIAIDITERREAETEIKQFKHMIESTDNPIGLVDRSFIYRYVNEPHCQALNKSRHEIVGHSVPELFGRDTFEAVMKQYYDRCFAGEAVDYQAWFDFPGWGQRHMDVRYYPFQDTDGQVTAVVTNVHDITQIKQIEIELQRSAERFRNFMNHSPVVAYIKNASGKHIYGNRTLFDAFNISSDRFVGTTTKDFFPAAIARKLEAHDKEVLSGMKIVEIEEMWEETQGDRRWWKEVKFPFTDYSGETLIGGLALNITELKKTEEDLKKALYEISALKDRLEQENIYLREEIEINYRHDEIVGESSSIKSILNQSEKVASQTTCVLILGETGTGKELLARAIHKMSPRHKRQMITVNCAVLPGTLIESELFGREKGAFTGAVSKELGRFIGPTEAHPGCLIFRLYSEMDDDDALLLLQEWRYQEDLDKFIRSRDFKRILAAMELASQTPEFCVNTVTSKSGWEFVEKLRLGLQAK